MSSEKHLKLPAISPVVRNCWGDGSFRVAPCCCLRRGRWPSRRTPAVPRQQQTQNGQKQQDNMPAEAGGPGASPARSPCPRRRTLDEEAPPPPKPEKADDIPRILAARRRAGGDRGCAGGAEGRASAGLAGGCGEGALQDSGRRRAAADPERDHEQGAHHRGAAGRVRRHQLQLHVRRAECLVRVCLQPASRRTGWRSSSST